MSARTIAAKLREWLTILLQFLFNPRFLLCFGMAWMITNGWSYVLLLLGSLLRVGWMMAIAGAYLAVIWLPFSPEKLLTLSISMVLLKLLFPKDQKTLGVLQGICAGIRQRSAEARAARRQKRLQRRQRRSSSQTRTPPSTAHRRTTSDEI